MTQNQFSILITQVHAVSLAIAEILAVCTFTSLHPGAVTIWLVTVLPYINEVILVDVALSQIAADACAGGDGSVNHY